MNNKDFIFTCPVCVKERPIPSQRLYYFIKHAHLIDGQIIKHQHIKKRKCIIECCGITWKINSGFAIVKFKYGTHQISLRPWR